MERVVDPSATKRSLRIADVMEVQAESGVAPHVGSSERKEGHEDEVDAEEESEQEIEPEEEAEEVDGEEEKRLER